MQSKKIATCGLLCALSIVIMMLGSFIGVGAYAAPLLCFWLLLPIRELYGNKDALTAFFAVAVIGILILPDRELAVFYCAFGWWPVAKTFVDRIPGKALRFCVKAAIYLAVVLVMMFTVINLLGLQVLEESAAVLFTIPGIHVPVTVIDIIAIAVGAGIFYYCDIMMAKISALLTSKVRKLMKLH